MGPSGRLGGSPGELGPKAAARAEDCSQAEFKRPIISNNGACFRPAGRGGRRARGWRPSPAGGGRSICMQAAAAAAAPGWRGPVVPGSVACRLQAAERRASKREQAPINNIWAQLCAGPAA